MNTTAIDRWKGARVLVIGDVMLDRYLFGTTSRIAQEAPVPVVDVTDVEESPGGAANVAACAAELGACVTLVGAVARDGAGSRLRHRLERQGVETHFAVAPWTLAKSRISGGDHVLLRFDEGRPFDPDECRSRALTAAIWHGWQAVERVIVSDYGYGVLGPHEFSFIETLQRSDPRPISVDARDLTKYAAIGPALVKPNFEQAWSLAGGQQLPSDRPAAVIAERDRLLSATGADVVYATLDSDGCAVLSQDEPALIHAETAGGKTFTNGAGDTFLAAVTLALHAGESPVEAARIASVAASLVVRAPGTRTCSAVDLRRSLGARTAILRDEPSLLDWCAEMRRAGRRIVFTNGVYDLLHAGHVACLAEARAQGDVLLVAVNDDDGVRRLKGPERPLNSLERRMEVLAGLAAVGAVVPFSEDTPAELLGVVRPDVYVKGGDYSRESLAETSLVESWGGRVHIAPFVDGHSTSGLISRARSGAGVLS